MVYSFILKQVKDHLDIHSYLHSHLDDHSNRHTYLGNHLFSYVETFMAQLGTWVCCSIILHGHHSSACTNSTRTPANDRGNWLYEPRKLFMKKLGKHIFLVSVLMKLLNIKGGLFLEMSTIERFDLLSFDV